MKILVTGGAGFIGYHLAEALKEKHDVIRVDRANGDLAVPYETERLIEEAAPDYVVHLGARYGRILCRDEPHRAVADNAAGTTELAAACAKRGIPVLYSSSSEVYGDHGEEPISERSELKMPTTIYGLSKRWGEEALRLYLEPEQLCVVRCNMLYGPRQRSGYGCCALAQFIARALRGESFTVHADTSRSWLYIDDAVRALVALIEGGHHGVYNLGNPGRRLSTEAVARLVCRAVGARSEHLVELRQPPEGQIRHKVYDCSKLIRETGWRPRTPLEEGIARTVEHEMKGAEVAA